MNILFLTHRLPYAPNRGDRIRAFHLMREMSRTGSVSLFSFVHDDAEGRELGHVPFATRVTGVRVPRARNLAVGAFALPTQRPLTHSLLDSPETRTVLAELVREATPDVVVGYCSGMARLAMEPPLSGFPFVFDMVDVDSTKWRELAGKASGPRRWVYRREARTLRAFEAGAASRASTTMVINEREREACQAIAPTAHVEVVPNGIDVDAFAPPGPPTDWPIVIFCGVMNYEPNVEGTRWFAERVWPHVRSARPEARFLVVGSNPSPTIRNLAERDASIEVVGAVPAVQPYLWRSAVSVAPLFVARGLQNKVLEALAAGLPVVATPEVMDGLPAAARKGCLSADSAETFGCAVLQALNMPADARRRLANEAELLELGWPSRLSAMPKILADAVRTKPRSSFSNGAHP